MYKAETLVSISDGVQAASLSLPCRDMCEAVTSTCGCGQERSVGDLLQKAMKGLLVSTSTTCYRFQESTVTGAPDHWLHRQNHAVVTVATFHILVIVCAVSWHWQKSEDSS